jgi:hypothetical protein
MMHPNQSNGFPCRCSDCELERRRMRAFDGVVDAVLAYRPKARSKPAVQRKRRKTILEKKHAAERK